MPLNRKRTTCTFSLEHAEREREAVDCRGEIKWRAGADLAELLFRNPRRSWMLAAVAVISLRILRFQWELTVVS